MIPNPNNSNVIPPLFPSTEIPTKKDAIELLEIFLDFMTFKSTSFGFWCEKFFFSFLLKFFFFRFNLFKEKYLMSFYPRIFQELRLLDKYDGREKFFFLQLEIFFLPDTGFKNGCPAEIQIVLVEKMSQWGEKPQIYCKPKNRFQ